MPRHLPHDLLEQLDEPTLDLLARRATQPLSGDEAEALRRSGAHDIDALDLAAAGAHVALLSDAGLQVMPDALRERLVAAAPARSTDGPLPFRAAAPAPFAASAAQWIGFGLAAVLGLVVGLAIAYRPAAPPPGPAAGSPGVAQGDPNGSTSTSQPRALYAQLTDAGVTPIAWNPVAPDRDTDFAQVTGDIVFDPATQTGVMRFIDLPVNDPDQMQYQLWIVDPARDDEPVDGGVFDVPADSSEAFVFIDAKLRADAPAAYVITVEQPGGVVKSEEAQFRLIAVPESPSDDPGV